MPVSTKERFAEVVIPSALRQTFTYRLGDEWSDLAAGTRVLVPFGRGRRHGYVVGFTEQEPAMKLKQILHPEPAERLFSDEVLDLTRWVANYYLAPWGQVLDAALPPLVRKSGSQSRRARRGTDLTGRPVATADEVDPGAEGIAQALPSGAGTPRPLVLTAFQQAAFAAARSAMEAAEYAAFLLQGVTGSGKTEVYIRLAEEALTLGGQVLLLVPEIGLSAQILARVASRFPGQVGLYHSQAGEGIRREVWAEASAGRLPIVVGARSAVFVPLPRLRLVIVDEEHEAAYKQDESPRYHGRDVAVYRAQRAKAIVVLGSATPSLESRANVEHGKYTLLRVPERIDGRPHARVQVVDMAEVAREAGGEGQRKPRPPILSPYLLREITERLDRREQTILFLNRRGHSTAVQCGACGTSVQCRQCDVVLTYHRTDDQLRCHYCNAIGRPPQACASCGGSHFHYGGFGTQRVEETLREFCPTARIERMDRDTTRRRGTHSRFVEAMEEGEIDILLGTQMVTKGFDFPRVTLVGVLQADQEMLLPDFRAGERGFQVLTQVAGRAGRGDLPGAVVFQTLMPEHYVIEAAARQDYERFASKEIVYRQELGYPPFRSMLHLLIDGPDEKQVERRAELMRVMLESEIVKRKAEAQLLGPAPMPKSRLKGQYRWHLSILARSREVLHRLGTAALEAAPASGLSRTRVMADMDPLSMV